MTNRAPIRDRSWLFTPATRPDRFAKASAAGADVAILDLEDAVAPGDKAQARTIALDYLADDPADCARHALRINGLDTRAGISDLDALLGSKAAPDFLVLPKTETAGHLQVLDRLLTAVGKATRLIGLIESARGLSAVEAIATATPRLVGLMLGAADMAADLGGDRRMGATRLRTRPADRRLRSGGHNADRCAFFRSARRGRLEAGSRRRGGVWLRRQGRRFTLRRSARSTPALTPSAEAVDKARAILAENAKGVGMVDGQMIDEAIARKARRILAAAGPEG